MGRIKCQVNEKRRRWGCEEKRHGKKEDEGEGEKIVKKEEQREKKEEKEGEREIMRAVKMVRIKWC